VISNPNNFKLGYLFLALFLEFILRLYTSTAKIKILNCLKKNLKNYMNIKTERQLNKAKKLAKKGEYKKASEILSKIIKILPENKEVRKALHQLNSNSKLRPSRNELDQMMAMFSSNQIDSAIISVENLISKYPDDAFLCNFRGACYSEIDSSDIAIHCFESAITLKPDYAEAHFNLGVLYHKLKEFNKAKKSYKNAIKFNNSYSTALNNLGLIQMEQLDTDSAIENFEWAIAFSPEYSEAHNNLGVAYQEIGNFDKAKSQFEKAVELDSNYLQAFHNLGVLCEMLNYTDIALYSYEQVVKIDPEFTEGYRNISKLKKFKANDPQISIIKDLYFRLNQDISDKAKLCFTLAKIYEDLGNKAKFFEFLNKGNNLRKQEINYSIDDSCEFQAKIKKLFAMPIPKIEILPIKPIRKKPIFIVGMPRSGTSLVEQIIASHSDVFGAGELNYLKETVSHSIENFINDGEYSLNQKDIEFIRENYLEAINQIKTSKVVITDKMPANFRLIGFILLAIPEAKIIHVKRDAIATCWSNYRHYFSSGNGFSFNQNDLVKFFELYSEIMSFWNELYPDQIYDLCYEELTSSQEKETKKLLKYCELDWDENCLNFHKNKRIVKTASAAQVRKKMYQGSSEEWKQFEPQIKTLIDGLKSY
jgi:tetratricopeptide (TPR) repeat protein